ncbi:MAG: response regulator [Ignavibacteriales bacterium]|nr:response regulator [Ignavibacteriales bacterium]
MSDPAQPRNVKILVAEDEPVNRVLMSKLLHRLGYRADFVDNGAEAVEASRRNEYDLVLMDIQMPEMDGFAASHEIIRSRPDKKPVIIAVTALAKDGIRDKFLHAGMNDYLQKPVDAEGLRQMLEKWKPTSNSSDSEGRIQNSAAGLKELHERLELLQGETEPSFVREILTMFMATAPVQLKKIQDGLERSDAKAVHAGSHALKGGSLNLGAMHLGSLCQKMENAGESGRLDEAKMLFEELMHEFERVRRELQKYTEAH